MTESMHPHDILVNIILNSALPISTTESPVAQNGILKQKFGYVFDIKKFQDGYETIFGENFRPTDGFLMNVLKKNTITIECKSYLEVSDDRFINQLLFYGTNETFKDIFIPDGHNNEILIVCYNIQTEINKILANIKIVLNANSFDKNIVVWSVEKEGNEGNYRIKKIYGQHIYDAELNQQMEGAGLLAKPLKAILFWTPETPENHQVADITKRILLFRVVTKEDNATVKKFVERQRNDSVLPDKKMDSLVRKSMRLFPEIGTVADGKIIFKKNLRFDSITKKINAISNMSSSEFAEFLKKDGKIRIQNKNVDPNQKKLEIFFN